MKEITQKYLNEFAEERKELAFLIPQITEAVKLIVELKESNKLLVCGNGGSAADSEHIAGEFLKSFMFKRRVPEEFRKKLVSDYGGEEGNFIADNLQSGVKCIPLTSFPALQTAFINDCNEKLLFAQLVNALGIENDVLLAISTSGNSRNVVLAAKTAKAKGLKVIALTGRGGGQLKDICDVLINVPGDVVYKIQEYHLPVYHLICLCVESELFDE